MFKQLIKDYFHFTRGERRGTLVLLFLILVLLASNFFLPKLWPESEVDFSGFEEEIRKLEQEREIITLRRNKTDTISNEVGFLFSFDPNTITRTDLKLLGLNNRIVNTLIRYREAGGSFRVKDDFKKVYGVTDSVFTLLYPYIDIASGSETNTSHNKDYSRVKSSSSATKLELNSADSITLLKLWGIGPVFASRIVKFRNILGGYYSLGQILEVYGLKQATFDTIKHFLSVDTTLITRMDLNRVTETQLVRHPYINAYYAKAIIRYRESEGRFDSVKDLLKYNLVPVHEYDRLHYYFKVQNSPVRSDLE
jgi:DNA uptake protein ComE-like DNA-binding protein